MTKDLVQLGFRLEKQDREWFVKKCEKQEILSATR